MRIGLFIPCYIDAFFPEVGIATLELLERFGHEVVYPRDQTCCGQPMANSGFNAECADTEALFARNFSGFDYVVAPSGSCVHHVRDNFDAIEQTAEVKEVRARTFELVEFLHDIQKVEAFPWARFPHRLGLHNSCGTLRRLKHAAPSELHEPFFSKEALNHLRCHAEGSLARVIINAGQEVAAADCRIDPREQHILQLIWITLGGPLPRPAARPQSRRRTS